MQKPDLFNESLPRSAFKIVNSCHSHLEIVVCIPVILAYFFEFLAFEPTVLLLFAISRSFIPIYIFLIIYYFDFFEREIYEIVWGLLDHFEII